MEIHRVLKPGGRALVLEFSTPRNALVGKLYDWYSFAFLPRMGSLIAKDSDSYRYLAESIRMHPDQDTLRDMFTQAGFVDSEFQNLHNGIVAIHKGRKAHA